MNAYTSDETGPQDSGVDARNLEDLTFEEALGALDRIVRKLEEGRLPLEEAIKAYEKGEILRKICEKRLEDARLKVEAVTVDKDGRLSLHDKTSSMTD